MVRDRMERAQKRLPEDSYLAVEGRGQQGELFKALARLLEEIGSMKMDGKPDQSSIKIDRNPYMD